MVRGAGDDVLGGGEPVGVEDHPGIDAHGPPGEPGDAGSPRPGWCPARPCSACAARPPPASRSARGRPPPRSRSHPWDAPVLRPDGPRRPAPGPTRGPSAPRCGPAHGCGRPRRGSSARRAPSARRARSRRNPRPCGTGGCAPRRRRRRRPADSARARACSSVFSSPALDGVASRLCEPMSVMISFTRGIHPGSVGRIARNGCLVAEPGAVAEVVGVGLCRADGGAGERGVAPDLPQHLHHLRSAVRCRGPGPCGSRARRRTPASPWPGCRSAA